MTTPDKSIIPEKVYTTLKRYAIADSKPIPYTIWDDTQCIAFLKKYYNPIVLAKFHELTGAHKADLFRYCYLYIKGGIYMDIKTKLTKPLDEVIDFDAAGLMYTVLMPTMEMLMLGGRFFRLDCQNVPNYTLFKRGIYQGIIISSPGNYIFLKLIGMCLKTPLSALKIKYLLFVQQAYQILKKNSKTNSLAPGLNKLDGIDCYLFQEVLRKCDKRDRYGVCSRIYDQKEKVADTRYTDYPWK